MVDSDSQRLKFGSIRLASRTNEIIDSEDFQVGPMGQQRLGQRAAYEPANSSDEDFHGENRDLRDEN